jgi:UDP-N-acetylmuramate--alanine ligase
MGNVKKIKKVHLVGIGGIGVSALARLFLQKGLEVSGSDVAKSEITDELKKLGVKIFVGHKKENVPSDADIVVFSSAVLPDNPEILAAKKIGAILKSYPEMLGMIMDDYFGIAISGTNGKTTTTSLVGLILESAGMNPSVIVGGRVKIWDGNFRQGKGKYFVVEACEYRRHMLNLNPKVIVLTNIEEDHLDYYKDLADIKNAFGEYIGKLKKDDLLIYNADDKNILDILKNSQAKKISYGIKNTADLMAQNIKKEMGAQKFELIWKGKKMGELEIFVPGDFNIYNFLAASALSLELGADINSIKKVCKTFKGTWRRFEKVGEFRGRSIISDYAHHPTAVQKTIEAAREFYPHTYQQKKLTKNFYKHHATQVKKGGNFAVGAGVYPPAKILVVFQPHQQNRTRMLFNDFVKSFKGADGLILSEIYQVEGREEEKEKISSKDLLRVIEKLEAKLRPKNLFYAKNKEEVLKILKKNILNYDVVIVMGAGDIYQIAYQI